MFSLHEIKLQDESNWDDLVVHSATATFFQTKSWLEIWLKHFPVEHKIIGVYEDEEIIGIAPFILTTLKGSTFKGVKGVGFLGVEKVLSGELVSDYGDIIAKKGREKEVWVTILEEVRGQGSGVSLLIPETKQLKPFLEFNFIREDSHSYQILKELGGKEEIQDEAPYLDLPETWDLYLESLDRHNRHELKRKMRKIENEEVQIVLSSGNFEDIRELFRLMEISDVKKKSFLSEKMKDFFQDVIIAFCKQKKAELMFMRKDNINIAITLSFQFRNEVLLYNSGFDPQFGYLSAGFMLKAHLIKRAIEQKKKRFDFLRGNERYKYDLGGKERNLYKIRF